MPDNDLRECPNCGREVKREDMSQTYDRYGIPWKLVCNRCYDREQNEINAWQFDPTLAGECLEPEDY